MSAIVAISLELWAVIDVACTFQDKVRLYMLTELVQGGELFSRLLATRTLDEETVRFYTACIVLALACLHAKNNVYRDLKPENVLIDTLGYVKIVDFGFAKKLPPSNTTNTTCG